MAHYSPLYYYTPVSDPEALIEKEYHVRRPNGEIVCVNRFDFNLLWCADKERYIQCSDMGWSNVKTLAIVPPTAHDKGRAAGGRTC